MALGPRSAHGLRCASRAKRHPGSDPSAQTLGSSKVPSSRAEHEVRRFRAESQPHKAASPPSVRMPLLFSSVAMGPSGLRRILSHTARPGGLAASTIICTVAKPLRRSDRLCSTAKRKSEIVNIRY